MANEQRTMTSTQIRNFYSDGMAYMNLKFYNTKLSFQLCPFISKDNMGRSSYDTKNGVTTTVGFDEAFALYQCCKDIIDKKINTASISIPCASNTTIMLERVPNSNSLSGYETLFSITKNNATIRFRFAVIARKVTTANGEEITEFIEHGLGSFMKTIEGYLTGINAERHLNKLTEDYVNSLNNNNTQNNQFNNSQNNFRKNNFNNGGNSNRRRNFNNNNNWNNNNVPVQSMDSYNIN